MQRQHLNCVKYLDALTVESVVLQKMHEGRMNSKTNSNRKSYTKPKITKVKLEDKRVVAMAVCKDSIESTACAQDGVTPLFQINPS